MTWADRLRKSTSPESGCATAAPHDGMPEMELPKQAVAAAPPKPPQLRVARLSADVWDVVLAFTDVTTCSAAASTCKVLRAIAAREHLWQQRVDALELTVAMTRHCRVVLPDVCSNGDTTLRGRYLRAMRWYERDWLRELELRGQHFVKSVPLNRLQPAPRRRVRVEEVTVHQLVTASGYNDATHAALLDVFDHATQGVATNAGLLIDSTTDEHPEFLETLRASLETDNASMQNPQFVGLRPMLVEINQAQAAELVAQSEHGQLNEHFATAVVPGLPTRFFSGPQLCTSWFYGVLIVDALRIVMIRGRNVSPSNSSLSSLAV